MRNNTVNQHPCGIRHEIEDAALACQRPSIGCKPDEQLSLPTEIVQYVFYN
jgi:hypothetical protein